MFIDINRKNGLSFIKREVSLMQAYCVKCRAKKEMKDAKAITIKNGKPATQGVCPTCGTKMFRIGKS
jgi:NAD-dependent SIR2 family protein deacetylase